MLPTLWAPRPPVAPPPTYTIKVWNAVVSPAKAGGNKPWDGTKAIPPDVMRGVVSALGTVNPYAAVVAAMGMLANGTYDPPDVGGDVSLRISGAPVQTQELPKVEDSYVPSWSQPASFSRVPLDDRLSLVVHLVDRDAIFDDEIGVAVVTMADVREALAKGGQIHQVPVHHQHPQILMIGIAVFRE